MRPPVPLNTALRRFADPEGAFLDHDGVQAAIDRALGGFPSQEAIEAAEHRMQLRLARAIPTNDVAINRAALGAGLA